MSWLWVESTYASSRSNPIWRVVSNSQQAFTQSITHFPFQRTCSPASVFQQSSTNNTAFIPLVTINVSCDLLSRDHWSKPLYGTSCCPTWGICPVYFVWCSICDVLSVVGYMVLKKLAYGCQSRYWNAINLIRFADINNNNDTRSKQTTNLHKRPY